MVHNLEREKIRGIPEASEKLIDPFQKVVNIAMQRVREGHIDSLNRQTVTLSDDKNNREYEITDYSVGELRGAVISKGLLDVGLFIDAIRLDTTGNQDKWIFSIQLPRNPDLVHKENLDKLRGFNSKEVDELAVALSSARKL